MQIFAIFSLYSLSDNQKKFPKKRYNMLKEFIQKITDWALEKEDELAKKCEIPVEEIDRQLNMLHEKRDELKKKCDEQLKEIDSLIERVNQIKTSETLRCKKD